MRVVRKQFTQILIAPGQDKVMALMPIPPGGAFLSVSGEVHTITNDVNKDSCLMLPSRVYACQMTEIDDLIDSWDDLWDRYVPKDEDTSESAATYTLDMSRDSEDQAPFEEPGESSPNELFGVREPSEVLFKRDRLLSLANSPIGYEGASVDTFSATEVYGVNVRRRIAFPQGGFVAFGIASPSWDDVDNYSGNSPNAIASIQDLLMYGNLPDFLHVARLAIIGATEAGAETPFVDVLSLIEELTEPTVYESNNDKFFAASSALYSRFIFSVDVPENPETRVLKSD
jgi:hypothetical protein